MDEPETPAHTGNTGGKDRATGREPTTVVLASFESSHAAEHMVASLGHGFRKEARTGDPAVFVVTRNRDGSFKLHQSRVITASGLFEPGVVPDGHDRYVMQAIMHDWPDDKAGIILRNIRAAMSAHSRLWVIDSILDPAEPDDLSKAIDMLTLTLTEGGRERTQNEWQQLFSTNGLGIESQTQLPLLISVFTLAPA